jgi:hypothetical protein
MRSGRIAGFAFLAIGALLLGGGLTGNVISQSCCFGDACPAEQLCDAASPSVEGPTLVGANMALGAFLVLLGALFLALDARSGRRAH